MDTLNSSAKMANPLMNQDALFNQYESEYCSKSTDITRKIQALSSFSAGNVHSPCGLTAHVEVCSKPVSCYSKQKLIRNLNCRRQEAQDKGN